MPSPDDAAHMSSCYEVEMGLDAFYSITTADACIQASGEWLPLIDHCVSTSDVVMKDTAQSDYDVIEGKPADQGEFQVNDQVQVIKEVHSADQPLVLCVDEIYQVLAFHNGCIFVKSVEACMRDGTCLQTSIDCQNLDCFRLCD